MSSYVSEPYTPGGMGAGDFAFPFPPNSRSTSFCDTPIFDPDFTYIDSFAPGASNPSFDTSALDGGSHSWYGEDEPSASLPAPHQPPHGLAPIVPPGGGSRAGQAQMQAPLSHEQPPIDSRYPAHMAYPYQQQHSAKYQQPMPAPYGQQGPSPHAAQPMPPPMSGAYNGQPLRAIAQHPQPPPHLQAFSQPPYAAPPANMNYSPALPSPPPTALQSASAYDSHSPVSTVSSSSSHSGSGVNGSASVHKRRSSQEGHSTTDADTEHTDDDSTHPKRRGKTAKKSKTEPATAKPAATAAAKGKKKPTATPTSTSTPTSASPADEEAASKPAVEAAPEEAPAANQPVSCWFDPTKDLWSSPALRYASNTFKTVLLSATSINPSNTTDIVSMLAHLMEVLPEQPLSQFLRHISYQPQPLPASDDFPEDRVVWRSPKEFLPYLTLPHRFRLNWSRSLDQTGPEDPSVINFPTLMWWREREMRFVRKGGCIIAVPMRGRKESMSQFASPLLPCDAQGKEEGGGKGEADDVTMMSPVLPSSAVSTPTIDSQLSTSSTSSMRTSPPPPSPPLDPAAPGSDLLSIPSLPPSEIDLACLDLPCHVEVNPAFERMFGWSQGEVKSLFMRYGKQAMARLAVPTQLRRIHEQSVKGMCEGQSEFAHQVDILTKYGSGMKTVMHHKLVVGEAGMVYKKIYMFTPLPATIEA